MNQKIDPIPKLVEHRGVRTKKWPGNGTNPLSNLVSNGFWPV